MSESRPTPCGQNVAAYTYTKSLLQVGIHVELGTTVIGVKVMKTALETAVRCAGSFYIRQVNVVNGGYTVMLAVVLSFCRSVIPCALSI